MPDFRLTIDVKNVGAGDVDQLVQTILLDHGNDFDAELGDFTIRVAQKEGGAWFTRDAGDDEL